jgi:hypothetical protein
MLGLQTRFGNPPDVWMQLLRHILKSPACRKALLACSSATATAPAELMLAQLAATLAEELAARTPTAMTQSVIFGPSRCWLVADNSQDLDQTYAE